MAAYHEDLNCYPCDGGTPDHPQSVIVVNTESKIKASNKMLLAFLRGDLDGDGKPDPAFLNAPYMDFRPYCLQKDTDGLWMYMDLWGTPYAYDENCSEGDGFHGQRREKFDIWSAGPDRKWGWGNSPRNPNDPDAARKDAESQDNITNW
ncbi:MAG: hypothetical protein V1809_10755 [Planctomycetota bacterium]